MSNAGSVLDTNAKKPRQGGLHAVRISDCRFVEMPPGVVMIISATRLFFFFLI